MKTKATSKSAFTLVEMLVVIAIISLVAMALSSAVRGAQRTANAAKCQAHMKNLHTAAVAFLADNGCYPKASSYETMSRSPSGKAFHEHVGWVSWVPKGGGKRRDANGKTPWQKGNDKSHADKFYFPANFDKNMLQAVSEGSLYKYVGKDPMTFRCPQHRSSKEGATIYLSYAMNSWFYSHSRLYNEYWELVDNGHPATGSRTTIDFTKQKENVGVPSRMALFIEMEDAEDDSSSGREGQSGDGKQKARLLKGDCVWEWSDVVGLEKGRYNFKKRDEGHFKGGIKYCNVVFVDGHVMAVPEVAEEPAEWNDHQDIEDVFKSLGKGSY